MTAPTGDRTAMPSTGNGTALLHELATLLQALARHGKAASIDLRSVPLSPGDLQELDDFLGAGAVEARIDALGESRVTETRYPGIWRVVHRNETGEIVAELIEVCTVPAILCAPVEDIAAAAGRLALQFGQTTSLAQS